MILLLCLRSFAASDYYYSPEHTTARNYGIFSIDAQYASFKDLRSDNEGDDLELENILNFNLNVRFYRTYSLVLIYGTNDDYDYKGLGLKIDLPGVFFLGLNVADLVRKRKLKDVNTYFHIEKLFVTEKNPINKTTDDRLGFGLDWFIQKKIYLNFELNLYSRDGNQFFSPSAGLGIEF